MLPAMAGWMRDHFLQGAGKVVYGSIVALTLMIVLDFEDARAGAAVIALLGALVAVACAEAYAEVLEEMLLHRRPLTRAERLRIVEGVALHMVPGLAPVAFFVLAATGALGLETAYGLAEWTGIALLGLLAFAAYRAAGGSVARSLLAGTLLTGVGLVVVVLKLVLEH